MAKSFIVKTAGEVTEVIQQEHTYVIQASSNEEARAIGRRIFAETYAIEPKQVSLVTQPFNMQVRAILAIVFMLIAIGLSFVPWFTETGHKPIIFKPDLVGTFLATIFYAAFVVRFKGIQKSVQSVLDILMMVTIVLLFAGFINIFLADTEFRFLFWTVPIHSLEIILVAIALAWLGMPLVSALCYLIVAGLAIGNITTLNTAMDYGFIYVLCAFIGLMLYFSIERTMLDATEFYQDYFDRGTSHFEKTFQGVKSQASSLATNLNKKINQRSKKK